MHRPIIITAPAYDHRSAGIRVLHTLCNELNLCGRPCYLVFYRFRQEGGADYYTTDATDHYCPDLGHIKRLPETTNINELRQIIDEAIVIYPEVLRINPLEAKRVVRFILNSPSYPMFEGPDDLIVCFSQNFWPSPKPNLMILIDEPMFNDHGTQPVLQRGMDCTYIGKGVKYGACFKIPGSVQLERTWPEDKESLAVMLRNTRYFFTWDLVTQTNCDAIRCGAIMVVMKWHPFTPDVLSSSELGNLPYAEATVVNNALQLSYNAVEYEEKRQDFLDKYRLRAQTNRQRTEAFITCLNEKFS